MTPYRCLIAALAVLAMGLMGLSVMVGVVRLPLDDSIAALFGRGDPLLVMVMQELRAPRAVLALVIGMSLALAGAAMQGFLRNPLAEPGVVGTSGFAGLGAVLALQSPLVQSFAFAVPLAALAGAAASVMLLLLLAGARAASTTLILAGVALSALSGALVSLVLNLSRNPFAANEVMFWLMGSVTDRSWVHVAMTLPILALGAGLIWRCRRGLDALSLGEETARSMGVNIKSLRLQLVLGCACLAGASTAVAGMIGFVGLVVPHLLRPLTGGLPSRLLLPAALGGGALLLAADIAARLILPEQDLKLGVLTALIGTPVFLHLVYRARGRME